ncbi:MAG: nucleotidyltransferase domain-containing protein [Myxococcota bacterium]
MLMPDLDLARRFVAGHRPAGTVLLVGVTGSHDYGFPSADSDLDLKGIHLAPIEDVLGLDLRHLGIVDRLEVFEGVECDLTLHEAVKALSLLLRGNGNMLERIASRFQLYETPELDELRALLPAVASRRGPSATTAVSSARSAATTPRPPSRAPRRYSTPIASRSPASASCAPAKSWPTSARTHRSWATPRRSSSSP